MRKEVEMRAHRVLAAMAVFFLSGVCAADQGLRIPLGDDAVPAQLAGLRGQSTDWIRFSSTRPLIRPKVYETPRFGGHSADSAFGQVRPLPGGWSTRFDLGGGASEYSMSSYGLLAQVGKELGGGWGMSLGVQHLGIASESLGLGAFTVAGYYGNQQLSYTVYSGAPDERGMTLNQRMQWSYFVGDRGFFGLSLAQGSSVESAAPDTLPRSYVHNVTLFGRYAFLPDWAVSAEAETQEQVGQSRRSGVRFGLRHRF